MEIEDVNLFIVTANREFKGNGWCLLFVLESDLCSVFNLSQYWVDHFDFIECNHGVIIFEVIYLVIADFFVFFVANFVRRLFCFCLVM